MSTQVTTGSFTNVASTPFFIPLEQQINRFSLVNQSKLASYTSGRITNVEWNNYMVNGIALVDAPTTVGGVASTVVRTQLAQNGITIFNAASPQLATPVAIASFAPGNPTVWTCGGAHGLIVGDNVRVYGLTSSPQFGGLIMTVTAVGGGGTTFTTLLNSTGATTSVGFVQKIGNVALPPRNLYYPENRVIAGITNANPMVVTTLVQQNYAVGDVVTFDIPRVFGMPQLTNTISGLPFQATVIAANNAVGTQTVTLNVNSTNFGVFATNSIVGGSNPGNWPLAPAYPFTFPQLIPQGEGNTNNLQAFAVNPTPLPYGNQDVLSFAKQNLGFNGVLVGAGDGTAAAGTGGIIGATADVWTWTAITSLQTFP